MLSGAVDKPAISPLKIRGFPQETDHDQISVLRYMPFARLLSMVRFQAGWFSRVGALQDEFEGTNPRGGRAIILELAKNSPFVEKSKAMGLWDAMLASTSDAGRSAEGGRIGYVVNCWFLGNGEKAEMWKTFGDDGAGIAIRSTITRLSSAFYIPEDYNLVSRVGRINYVDFETHECANGNDATEVALLKNKKYENENEVRVMILNSFHSGCLSIDGIPWRPGLPAFSPTIKGYYIRCDLSQLMDGIIVGPNMRQANRDLIKKLIGPDGKPISVEYSQLAPWH